MNAVVPVRRALLSVYDKAGLADFAKGLSDLDVELVSTGSTARTLRDAGIAVVDVSDVTGFPEIMDGRVKTLHPRVHAGILADRSRPAHLAALEEHRVDPIDLVVVNLYPFRATVSEPGVSEAAAIEMIDIGGPTMVRAAAKNHAHVGVVVDPAHYEPVLAAMRRDGGLTAEMRRSLAVEAFGHTAAYDADVVGWLQRGEAFPARLVRVVDKVADLRYGENPHQAAAYYVEPGRRWGLGSASQLHGQPLSHNNLLDADAAWSMVADFEEPCVAIVKHTNPAGLAVAPALPEAYEKALAGDPTSAFGGIVAVNRQVDADTARRISGIFTEVVVAPAYSDEALRVLRGKAKLRLLQITAPKTPGRPLASRTVSGGLLVQEADVAAEEEGSWTVPTRAEPDAAVMADLRFAWRVCKHAKSNAIVLASNGATVGVGAGQMSRVDSVRIALEKSGGRHNGAVLASDAFFPFRDGPDAALDAGVAAIISPGGSVRDAEVVAACDERGVPMVFTGRRHFRH